MNWDTIIYRNRRRFSTFHPDPYAPLGLDNYGTWKRVASIGGLFYYELSGA